MVTNETAGDLSIHASEATATFVERAATAESPKDAADWALAARNMSSTLHSLVGAAGQIAKGRRS
jgi:hypothetical protein